MYLLTAIYDKKAEATLPQIMLSKNKALSIRDFTEIINKNEQFKKYKDDFKLIILGILDEEKGIITPKLEDIIEAKEVISEN